MAVGPPKQTSPGGKETAVQGVTIIRLQSAGTGHVLLRVILTTALGGVPVINPV